MGEMTQIEDARRTDISSDNRRVRVRYRCNPPNPGRAFFATSSKSVDAHVIDLSRGGIGFVTDSSVEPGTLVRIEMGNGSREMYVDLVAQVSHATQVREGTWRCGCEWVRPLSEDELQVLRG